MTLNDLQEIIEKPVSSYKCDWKTTFDMGVSDDFENATIPHQHLMVNASVEGANIDYNLFTLSSGMTGTTVNRHWEAVVHTRLESQEKSIAGYVILKSGDERLRFNNPHSIADLVRPGLNNLQIGLNDILALEAYDIDIAMQKLYAHVLKLMHMKKFIECDELLREFLLLPFSIEMAVAFARITRHDKEHFNNREKLINKIKTELKGKLEQKDAKMILSNIE